MNLLRELRKEKTSDCDNHTSYNKGNSTSVMSKERVSTIEVLRIVAMFMIILHHYTVYGGSDKIQMLNNGYSFNAYLLQISTLGELGVNIFVCILGYYTVKSSFSVKKILKLELQVLFYSILGYLILGNGFSLKEFIQNCLPFIFNKYWFFSVYIIIYMLSPFINVALNSIARTKHIYLGATTFILWSVIPSFTLQSMYVNEVLWFLTLYIIAAFFRLYPDCMFNNKKKGVIMFTISFLMMLVLTAVFDMLKDIWCFADYQTYFFSGKTVFAMLAAIGLFIAFINMKPFYNRVINSIGACTFGIYLIHDNSYVRGFLWNRLFNNVTYSQTNILFFHEIGVVVVVFVVCALIELLRSQFVEKIYMELIIRISNRIHINKLE